MANPEGAKKAVAEAALRYVPDSGVVGLGTGSTAKYFIEGIARLVKEGRKLSAVPTSEQSKQLAERLGIPLEPETGPWDITMCVDGADEVSERLDLIKGGGAAHTREKIVSQASRLNVIVVDESKLSKSLGEKWPVPIEVLRFGHEATAREIGRVHPAKQRMRDDAPVTTDAGNYVYDLQAGIIKEPEQLEARLALIPGVVETGLFCGRADVLLVAGPNGVRELRR